MVPDESVYLFPDRANPSRSMADRSLNAVKESLGLSSQGAVT